MGFTLSIGFPHFTDLGTGQRRLADVFDSERDTECKALAHQLQSFHGDVALGTIGGCQYSRIVTVSIEGDVLQVAD